MKKVFTLSLLILGVSGVYSQAYETRTKVYIPTSAQVFKLETAQDCKEVLPAGTIVKNEEEKKSGGKKFLITKIDTLDNEAQFRFEKEVEVEIKDFSGWGTLYQEESDKTKLFLNPWTNPKNKVSAGTIIKTTVYKINCDKEFLAASVTVDTLKTGKEFSLYKVEATDSSKINSDWFKKSNKVAEVYKKDSNELDYYLVDKYDQNSKYYLKLGNRDFISYKKRNFVVGPVIIPLKYRTGISKDSVDSEVTADFNAGVFGGYSWGRYRVRYENNTFKKLSDLSFTAGPFISISSVKLDSTSTTAGKIPYPEGKTKTIATFSPGLGATISVYNFNIGGFMGWDIGFGNEAKNWNYNKDLWFGFGLGYTLTPGFWKK